MAKVLKHRGIEVHQMYPDNEFYWQPKTGPARKAVSKLDAIAQINRYLGADVMPRIEAESISKAVSARIIDDRMRHLWANIGWLFDWVKDTFGTVEFGWMVPPGDDRCSLAVTLCKDGQRWTGYHREDLASAIRAALEAYRTNTQEGRA